MRACARAFVRASLSVLNGVRRSKGSYWIERCYLTASLFPSPRGYVRHSVTNCLSLPLIHKREHRVSQTTTTKQNKNRNVAFLTAEKPTALHLGPRLKIRFDSLTLGPILKVRSVFLSLIFTDAICLSFLVSAGNHWRLLPVKLLPLCPA